MMWIQCAAGLWMSSTTMVTVIDVECDVMARQIHGGASCDTTILACRTDAEASAAADELARLLNWYERGCPKPAPYMTTWETDGSLLALRAVHIMHETDRHAPPEPMMGTDRHTLAPPRR